MITAFFIIVCCYLCRKQTVLIPISSWGEEFEQFLQFRKEKDIFELLLKVDPVALKEWKVEILTSSH